MNKLAFEKRSISNYVELQESIWNTKKMSKKKKPCLELAFTICTVELELETPFRLILPALFLFLYKISISGKCVCIEKKNL